METLLNTIFKFKVFSKRFYCADVTVVVLWFSISPSSSPAPCITLQLTKLTLFLPFEASSTTSCLVLSCPVLSVRYITTNILKLSPHLSHLISSSCLVQSIPHSIQPVAIPPHLLLLPPLNRTKTVQVLTHPVEATIATYVSTVSNLILPHLLSPLLRLSLAVIPGLSIPSVLD